MLSITIRDGIRRFGDTRTRPDAGLMGFGLPDDGLRSPNEKYCIRNYFDGIRTIAHFFGEYQQASVF